MPISKMTMFLRATVAGPGCNIHSQSESSGNSMPSPLEPHDRYKLHIIIWLLLQSNTVAGRQSTSASIGW